MSRTNHTQNKALLNKLCKNNGYEIVWLSEYHARVLSGVVIADFWTPRMKYNVINIDGVIQPPQYSQLDLIFNKSQVVKILERGQLYEQAKPRGVQCVRRSSNERND